MTTIRIRTANGSVKAERTLRERLNTIHASTGNFCAELCACYLRNNGDNISSVRRQFGLLTRVVMLITGFRDDNAQAMFFVSFYRGAFRLLLTLFGTNTIIIASGMESYYLLRLTNGTCRVVRAFMAFNVLQDLIDQGRKRRAINGTSEIGRLVLNVTQVRVPSLRTCLNENHVRILRFGFARFSTVRNVNPFTARLHCVRLVNTRASFLVQVGTSAGFAILSFKILLRVCRHQCGFNGANFVVNAGRNLTINRGRVFPLVIRRFKRLNEEGGRVLFNTGGGILAIVVLRSAQEGVLTARVKTYVRINGGTSSKRQLIYVNEGDNRRVAVFIRHSFFRAREFRFFFRVPNGRRLPQDAQDGLDLFAKLDVRTCMLWGAFCWDRSRW